MNFITNPKVSQKSPSSLKFAKSIRSVALQRETAMWMWPFLNASSWPVSLFALLSDSLPSREPGCAPIHATLSLISVSPLLEIKACPISILYAGVQLQTWTIRRAKPGPRYFWGPLKPGTFPTLKPPIKTLYSAPSISQPMTPTDQHCSAVPGFGTGRVLRMRPRWADTSWKERVNMVRKK